MNENRDPVDVRLRAWYEAARLDSHDLSQLQTAIEAERDSVARERAHPRRRIQLQLIASSTILVGLAVGWFVSHLLLRAPILDGRSAAAEVVRHHRQDLPAEFPSETVAGLAERMPRLRIAPIDPERLRTEGLSVLGGRYCSIGGVPALQVRLRDAASRTCTLFELPADPALRHIEQFEEHLVEDVRVRLWREGNLVLVLAQPR